MKTSLFTYKCPAGLRRDLKGGAQRWHHSPNFNTQICKPRGRSYALKTKNPRRRFQQRPCCSIVESIAIDGPVRDALAFSVSILGSRLLVRIFDALETSGKMDKVGQSL